MAGLLIYVYMLVSKVLELIWPEYLSESTMKS